MTGDHWTGSRTGIDWVSVYHDPRSWSDTHPEAAVLVPWITDHLLRPHPRLGREGPVCPFMRQAVSRQTLWAGVVDGDAELTDARMIAAVDDAAEIHRALRESDPYAAALATVAVFPRLTRYDRVDEIHRARKSALVADGMMLGQFYPGCAVSGLWNHDFHPLDAPLPMLVIRRMVATDFPFLVGRVEWLYSYFTHIAPDLPRALRWAIARRLYREGDAVPVSAFRVHGHGEHAR